MLLVGLTGGIGSGKSTLSALLAERGAVVVDADLIAREVVAPGGPAYAAVVEKFGSEILDNDGTINRARLADIVFRDEAARGGLEAITHPAVGQVMADRIAASAASEVVILDIPLLAEKGRMGVSAVIVVDCPEEIAIDRVVTFRGFEPDDARRRVAAQLPRARRLELADIVIDNSGSRERLVGEADRIWRWLEERRDAACAEASSGGTSVRLDGNEG